VESAMKWAALPRESRDTLFLLATLAWTMLPQLTHVPPWCAALAYAALGWRAWLAWSGGALPSRWLLVLALLGAAAGTLVSHQSLLGPSAGVTLLVVMSALKTLELRARRDATVVFFLGFFLVLANFLHSQSLVTALAMGLSVWLLVAALVLAHLPSPMPGRSGQLPDPDTSRATLPHALALSARLLLTGLPLVIVLFLLFPRVAPLWTMPGPGTGKTGLSDQLTLGDIAELAQDDSLALRLQFEGAVPAPSQLYFRGPVLSESAGSGWQRRTRAEPIPEPESALTAARTAPRVRYEMTVEPMALGTLPLLENARTGPTLPDVAQEPPWGHHPEGYWFSPHPLSERTRVLATAMLDTPVHARESAADAPVQADDPRWAPYLALDADQHPRTLAWADAQRRNFRSDAADSTPRAQWLLDHIREQPFVYTLVPGPGGRDPVDVFWLDSRAGFCEHYASAVTVVLRRWGIPARIVTGYLGGEVNPLNGVLEVRQRDAHAWVEYWHAARGWVRLDPTGAVAPERIRRGERLVAPRGRVGQMLVQLDPQLLEQARAAWGAAEHHWNQWVLGYSVHRQQNLLARLGWEGLDSRDLGRLLAGGFAAMVCAGAAVALWQVRRQRQDPWMRGHSRLQQILRRRGYEAPDHLAPSGLLDCLRQQTDADLAELAVPLEQLSQWRYAPDSTRTALHPLWRTAHRTAARLLAPRNQ
jgi:protein-glutamine gamma-glutamyltransferase